MAGSQVKYRNTL